MQGVAGVLDERDLVSRQEGDVVEPAVGLVGLVEHRQRAGVGARARSGVSFMIEPQPPAASFSGLVALVSPVSSKKNFVKLRARLELAVLGTLERRRALAALASVVGVERRVAVDGRVVDRHPAGLERLAVGVQRQLVGAVERFLAGDGDRVAACRSATCSACSLPFCRSPGWPARSGRRSCSGASPLVPGLARRRRCPRRSRCCRQSRSGCPRSRRGPARRRRRYGLEG